MKKKLLLIALATLVLSSCSVSNQPTTKRGQQHFDAINMMVKKSDEFGFAGGEIRKQCEIAFDCTANDLYEYFAPQNINPENKFSDEEICSKLFAYGEKLDFNFWRRDWHEPAEEVVDITSSEAGISACVETMATADTPANGGSEGIVLHGEISGYGKPIAFAIQLNSYLNDAGKHDFSLIIINTDEVWPIPTPASS